MMRFKKEFTLVELIVVLSVLVILMSSLISVLDRSVGLAKSAYCRENIKNQLTGFFMYANNNNGSMPMGESFDDGGSGNYSCFLNLSKGYHDYSYFAIMKPIPKWQGGGYYSILDFEGEMTDLESLVCPDDSAVVYGENFSTSKFPASAQRIGYSYRGIKNPPSKKNLRYANYGGPDKIYDSTKAIVADRLVGNKPSVHDHSYNVGYSDGAVKNIEDSDSIIRSYGLLWKRSSIWPILDD